MRITALAVTAGTALVLVPATFAAGPPEGKGPDKPAKTGTTGTSGTTGSTGSTGATGPKAPKGNAYGFYCKGTSKKRVAGTKGTPFSNCIKALKAADAAAAKGKKVNPAKLCKAVPKTKLAGAKKTQFSICVSGAKKVAA